MSDKNSILSALGDKIENLIVRYQELEIKNEKLEIEAAKLKEQNEQMNEQILILKNELEIKSIETDELLQKIESVLGI